MCKIPFFCFLIDQKTGVARGAHEGSFVSFGAKNVPVGSPWRRGCDAAVCLVHICLDPFAFGSVAWLYWTGATHVYQTLMLHFNAPGI